MKRPAKKYPLPDVDKLSVVEEYEAVYELPQKTAIKELRIKNVTYTQFKKIVDMGPFTLNDWADLLYISERTLHRYAKDGGGFNGLQIERLLLLSSLIDLGNAYFGADGFRQWVQGRPFSLNGVAVKEKLTTHQGIQDVIDLLHRMEQGISA